MSSNQIRQDIVENQLDLFDPTLIEMYDEDIPVTVLSGNLNSLDIDLIRLEVNDNPISINVTNPDLKQFYLDNPYAIFWKILNDLRYSQDFATVIAQAGFRVTYEYNT